MKQKEFFRCDTCGQLLGDDMIHRGVCGGHKLKPTNRCNLWEWFLIKIGRIR